MNSIELYFTSLLLAFLFTSSIFPFALKKKNNSLIDRFYGIAFIVIATALAAIQLHYMPLPTFGAIIYLLVVIWGVRLAMRIHKKYKHKGEDSRYKEWREQWSVYGETYVKIRSYLQVFVLQAFVISIVLLPFTLTLASDLQNIFGYTFALLGGLLLWITGFIFESVGDAQLDTFMRGRHEHGPHILTKGLWKYSRHPNYFGESAMWTGLAIIGFGATMSLFTFLSPILITLLLLYVSGIPLIEKKWEGNKEWEEYKAKTSAFFPLP